MGIGIDHLISHTEVIVNIGRVKWVHRPLPIRLQLAFFIHLLHDAELTWGEWVAQPVLHVEEAAAEVCVFWSISIDNIFQNIITIIDNFSGVTTIGHKVSWVAGNDVAVEILHDFLSVGPICGLVVIQNAEVIRWVFGIWVEFIMADQSSIVTLGAAKFSTGDDGLDCGIIFGTVFVKADIPVWCHHILVKLTTISMHLADVLRGRCIDNWEWVVWADGADICV